MTQKVEKDCCKPQITDFRVVERFDEKQFKQP